MKKKITSLILALLMVLSLVPAFAASDANNGDWSAKTVTRKNTAEAELMVRVGDIDALNDYGDVDETGYNPFSAANQLSHSYPWPKDGADPAGTDRIFVGSKWSGESCDGYCGDYISYKNGDDTENAYGDGALEITMSYDAAGISVKNALLQLCIDDFQALSWESNFTVKLNGKDAPFIAELLNHVDQTGPTAYVVSAIIPASFYDDIASGRLVVTIDETTGCGDGYAVDFAKLLVNYKKDVFQGTFIGRTEPGATVRLLGTSTTVTASSSGGFEFEAVPGLNAVRASKDGYVEGYDYGIVFAKGTVQGEDDEVWTPNIDLYPGQGHADIDFSQFGVTAAWENSHSWAQAELQQADALGLIPDSLKGADLTLPITRAEFAAVSVLTYQAMTGETATPVATNPFKDTTDEMVLKAVNVGITNGTGDGTTFSPGMILNRETMSTMLTRVYKKATLPGWTLATDGQFKLDYTKGNTFADDQSISPWAYESVYFMAANGIVKGGDGNKFFPNDPPGTAEALQAANATREQALMMAARMVTNLG